MKKLGSKQLIGMSYSQSQIKLHSKKLDMIVQLKVWEEVGMNSEANIQKIVRGEIDVRVQLSVLEDMNIKI